MKKLFKKVAAIGLASTLGACIVTGCGLRPLEIAIVEPEEEYAPEEIVEFPEEEPEEAMKPVIEPEVSDEEYAEGLSDQVILDGFYGLWDGNTKYMFTKTGDTTFMINVVGESSPILYAEGTLTDNNDGTFTATITETDNDYAADKTFSIKAGGPELWLSAEDPDLSKAVTGTYEWAGEKATDVDDLKGAE